MVIATSNLILFWYEWVVVVIGIHEVLTFGLGQDIRIQTDVFHGFPWSIQANANIMS